MSIDILPLVNQDEAERVSKRNTAALQEKETDRGGESMERAFYVCNQIFVWTY
jgi:hypothetical protein